MNPRRAAAPALLASLVLLLSACGQSGSDSDSGSASSKTSASPSSGGSPSGAAGSGSCTYTPSQDGTVAKKVDPPPSTPVATGSVNVTIKTNFGDMTATLDGKDAPCAVNSFLSLAKQGYFDKTTCHRVTSASQGFHVLQCGDPTGTGTGTPGYRFGEEITGKEDYRVGSLALANTGQPDSSGGQFFIDYNTTQLPQQYTQFGQLTSSGLKVAQKAAAAATKGTPDGYDGAPVTKVELVKVTQN